MQFQVLGKSFLRDIEDFFGARIEEYEKAMRKHSEEGLMGVGKFVMGGIASSVINNVYCPVVAIR